MHVRDIMTTKVFTIQPDKHLRAVEEIMKWAHVRHVPVVDEHGRLVGIECKRRGGKASPDQLACIDAINRAGGVAFVARGIEDVERALRLEGLL